MTTTATEYYKVIRIFRVSGRRQVIERNLSREEAKRVVNRYPDSSTSMVVFMQQNSFSKAKK
jgi:hypothetical protein